MRHQPLGRIRVPIDSPAGWLEHWVDALAGELEARFQRFDLRHIESASEWRVLARRLGWTAHSQHNQAEP